MHISQLLQIISIATLLILGVSPKELTISSLSDNIELLFDQNTTEYNINFDSEIQSQAKEASLLLSIASKVGNDFVLTQREQSDSISISSSREGLVEVNDHENGISIAIILPESADPELENTISISFMLAKSQNIHFGYSIVQNLVLDQLGQESAFQGYLLEIENKASDKGIILRSLNKSNELKNSVSLLNKGLKVARVSNEIDFESNFLIAILKKAGDEYSPEVPIKILLKGNEKIELGFALIKNFPSNTIYPISSFQLLYNVLEYQEEKEVSYQMQVGLGEEEVEIEFNPLNQETDGSSMKWYCITNDEDYSQDNVKKLKLLNNYEKLDGFLSMLTPDISSCASREYHLSIESTKQNLFYELAIKTTKTIEESDDSSDTSDVLSDESQIINSSSESQIDVSVGIETTTSNEEDLVRKFTQEVNENFYLEEKFTHLSEKIFIYFSCDHTPTESIYFIIKNFTKVQTPIIMTLNEKIDLTELKSEGDSTIFKISPKNPNQCASSQTDDSARICEYTLELRPSEANVSFSVEIKIDQHLKLGQGASMMDFLTAKNEIAYQLDTSDSPEKIIIQVTQISGEVSLHAYDHIASELSSIQINGIENKLVISPKEGMSYFVEVRALVNSIFTISAQYFFKSDKNPQGITLHEGYPEYGVALSAEDEFITYQIELKAPQKADGSVRINVDMSSPGLLYQVSADGNAIGNGEYRSNFVEISWKELQEASKTKEKIKVLIKVQRARSEKDQTINTSQQEIHFMIWYQIWEKPPKSSHLINKNDDLIPTGSIRRITLSKDMEYRFRFLISDYDSDHMLLYSPQNSYLELNNRGRQLDAEQGVQSKNSQNSFILMAKEQIHDACTYEQVEAADCYVTFDAKNAGSENIFAQFMLKSGHNPPMIIEEGHKIIDVQPKKQSQPLVYYFFPGNHQVIEIDISGYSRVFNLYISHKEYDPLRQIYEYVPTEYSYDYLYSIPYSETTNKYSVEIEPRESTTSAIMVISLEFPDLLAKEDTNIIEVLIHQQRVVLYEGQEFHGKLEAGQEQLFSYFKPNDLGLHIQAVDNIKSSMQGKSVIYVQKYSNGLPSEENNVKELELTNYSETWLIDEADYEDLQGSWNFLISCKEKCDYVIMVTSGDTTENAIKASFNVPIRRKLGNQTDLEIRYNAKEPGPFGISMQVLSGNLWINIFNLDQITGEFNHLSEIFAHKNYNNLLNVEGSKLEDAKNSGSSHYRVVILAVDNSEFIITFTTPDTWQVFNPYFTYHFTLKPKESRKYLYMQLNEENDAQLEITSRNYGLNIYASHNPTLNDSNFIWAEKITKSDPKNNFTIDLKESDYQKAYDTQSQIWDGNAMIDSSPYLYYMIFENANKDKELKFSAYLDDLSKGGNTILREGHIYYKSLSRETTYKFDYQSATEGDEITIFVEYQIPIEAGQGQSEGVFNHKEFFLKAYQHIEEDDIRVIPLAEDVSYSVKEFETNTAHLKQYLTLKSEIGRYQFTLLRMGTFSQQYYDVGIYVVNTNNEYEPMEYDDWKITRLVPESTKIVEIEYPDAGVYYLDITRCQGSLSLQNQNPDLSWGKSIDLSHNASINNKLLTGKVNELQTVRLMMSSNEIYQNADLSSSVFVHSSFFPNETKIIDFDTLKPGKIKSFEYQSKVKASKMASFNIEFTLLDAEGLHIPSRDLKNTRIVYFVSVCEEEAEVLQQINCKSRPHMEGCIGQNSVSFGLRAVDSVSQKPILKSQIEIPVLEKFVKNSYYYASVGAYVVHRGKMVKSFDYPITSKIMTGVDEGSKSDHIGPDNYIDQSQGASWFGKEMFGHYSYVFIIVGLVVGMICFCSVVRKCICKKQKVQQRLGESIGSRSTSLNIEMEATSSSNSNKQKISYEEIDIEDQVIDKD